MEVEPQSMKGMCVESLVAGGDTTSTDSQPGAVFPLTIWP